MNKNNKLENKDNPVIELAKDFNLDENDLSVINQKNSLNINRVDLVLDSMRETLDSLSLVSNNKNKSFALPALPVMFNILPLFTGKPTRKNRELKNILTKPETQRTSEEKMIVEENLQEKMLIEEKTEVTSFGKIKKKSYTVFSSNSSLLASLEGNFKDETLANYVNRVFGAEGMRHLLALISSIEEHGRNKTFKININSHLEIMGYKREKSGSFNSRLKLVASDIIKIFANLSLTTINQSTKNNRIISQRLFTIVSSDIKLDFNNEIIDGDFQVRVEDWWYNNAFSNNEQPKYYKIMNEVILEDHNKHAITISLVPILGAFWSSNQFFEVTIKKLMDWCNLDHLPESEGGDKQRMQRLRDLEEELDYMKYRGYLRDWKSSNNQKPSESDNPFDCLITLESPKWFMRKINEIKEHKDTPEIKKSENIIGNEEFIEIIESSGLKIEDVAEKLGVSKRTIQYIKSFEKPVSAKLAKKLIESGIMKKG